MIKKSTTIIVCVLVFLFTAATVGLACIAGTVLFFRLKNPVQAQTAVSAGEYGVLDEIRGVVHNTALWDTDDETLITNAADAMIFGTRDIYSDYFTPDEYREYLKENEGQYEGVGMRVALDQDDGLVTILFVYGDGPAAKAGLRRGDKIVSVDGEAVPLHDMDSVKNKVRGESGTSVQLGILRDGEVLDFTVGRAEVISENCEWHMINDNIGYLHIIEFNGNAGILYEKGMNEMLTQGMEGLILDLRDNGGGDKDMVCAIADTLLPEGKIITMIDKNGTVIDEETSDAVYLNIPMVVLVNENTASASELLSGNIQDYGVGKLVGVTTYGKGVGQTFCQLSDGSVVRFTAFSYLTGGGRCPQDVGITPDVEVEMSDEVLYNQLLWCTEKDDQYMKAMQLVTEMMDSDLNG